MSATENEQSEEGPPKIQRASERKRAYRIRKKPIGERSQDDIDWLAAYDDTKRKGAPPIIHDGGTPEPEAESAPIPEDDGPAAPPPPPPPRVDIPDRADEPQGPTGGSDWRRKYQTKGKDAGRERTVTIIAAQWKQMLEFCCEQIKMSGGTPMVDVAALYPHIVLTVDDMLPEKVVIKPSHIAAVGSTVIIAQRIARHKKVGEAYERQAKNPTADDRQSPAFTDLPKTENRPSEPSVQEPSQGNAQMVQSHGTGESSGVSDAIPDAPAPLFTLTPDIGTDTTPRPGDVF
jgi:hypothetical protein